MASSAPHTAAPRGFHRSASIGSAVALVLLALGAAPVRAQIGEGLEPSLALLDLGLKGQEYDKSAEYVAKVSEALGGTGRFAMLSRDDAERQIKKRMITSSKRVTDERLKEIEAMVKEGDDLAFTNPRKAIDILAKAKAELKAIMETLSLNQKIRRDYFRTQMLLARSHHDNGNRAKAGEIMEEIIRVFGDEVKVTDDEYHPDIVALYRETYRRLGGQRNGSLTVRTEPAGAEVVINGKAQQKRTPATYEGLYPGTITVIARKDGRESMVHKVEISATNPSEISVDIDFETSLAFDDTHFGFIFPDEDTLKRRIADFASRIGSQLSVDYILVTGLVGRDGRTYLDGHLVNVVGQTVERSESLYTKSNVVSNNRTSQMADLMAGIDVSSSGGGPAPTRPWYDNWIGWAGVGVGVVGLATGAAFYSKFNSTLDEVQCSGGASAGCKPQPERQTLAGDAESQRAVAGTMFTIGALGLAGGAAAFVLLGDDGGAESAALKLEYVAPTVSVHGAGGGVGAAFSF